MNELGLFAKQVALNLEINTSTLRRWALELEKQGYVFTRNEKDQRLYYERDINALSDFKKLLEKTQSLESAAKAVAARAEDKKNAEKALSVITEKSDQITFTREELDALIERVADEAATRTAEQLMRKFDDVIERRDRQLLNNLNDSIEQQQLAAAAVEEKPSFMSRLFGSHKKQKNSEGS